MHNQHAPPEGAYFKNGALTTHFLSYGEGPAVLFLHGSGPGASAYSNFKQNINAVINAGHQAILVDMVGFGYSSKPTDCDYRTDLFADNVKALIDHLALTQVTLLGNSLGGAICLRLALDFPDLVKRLVLMAPGGIEDKERYFAMPGIAKMVNAFVDGGLDRDGLKTILQILVHDADQVSTELIEERFCILQKQPPEVLSRMIIPNMAGELAQLRCPIYGFWGEQDQMTPVSGVQHFTRQCPRVQFTTIGQCGHWVMVEYAELFNYYLEQILLERLPC